MTARILNTAGVALVLALLSQSVLAQARPGDSGLQIDKRLLDSRFPQMSQWGKAGVRGGIPPLESHTVKKVITASSSSNINNAIRSVANQGGGAVFMKNGTYTIDDRIDMKSNVVLIGESRRGVIARIFMNKRSAFYFGPGVKRSGIYRMRIAGSWGRPNYDWNIGDSRRNNELPGNENVSVMFKRGVVDSWIDGVDIINSGDFPLRNAGSHITMRGLNVRGVHNKHGGAHGYFFILGDRNLLTQSRITRLRHISIQGSHAEYNVVYDNYFRQEISFHSGDRGNNLIEKNRITLPADMPNGSRQQPDYRAIMGPWSSKHRKSNTDNFIYNNYLLEANHGNRVRMSGDSAVYAGPIYNVSRGEKQTRNFPKHRHVPRAKTLYPINLGSAQ